ncbi:MAG: hypothetical protein Kow0010_25970 [Dehalococcoidia bacterium]
MPRRHRHWAVTVAFAVALAIAACGGPAGFVSTPTPTPEPKTDERGPRQPAGAREPMVAASASGSVIIDGVPGPVSLTSCGFDPEDAGNRDIRFVAAGVGTSPRHGTFRLWLADVDDGAQRLQRLELTFAGGGTIASVARVLPAGSPPLFFDPGTLTIRGAVSATHASADGAPTIVNVEVDVTCPALTDGQQPQLRTR